VLGQPLFEVARSCERKHSGLPSGQRAKSSAFPLSYIFWGAAVDLGKVENAHSQEWLCYWGPNKKAAEGLPQGTIRSITRI